MQSWEEQFKEALAQLTLDLSGNGRPDIDIQQVEALSKEDEKKISIPFVMFRKET